MVDPEAKAEPPSGPQWFNEMVSFFGWLKEKEDAGLYKVIDYQDLVRMHCPEVLA